jgi:uncharacterized protein involved in response to NO
MSAATRTPDERLRARRDYAGPVFLREGFRPLFQCAALWAALAVPLWACVWTGTMSYRGALDPLLWHVHEMIFGFIAAAVGGFLLTAVPNWTGRLPVRGLPLAVLALVWAAGRVAVWFAADIGAGVAAAIDLAYLGGLALLIAREILAGRNWRNLPVLALLTLLVAANALFHVAATGLSDTGDLAVRLSIGVMAVLLALIGGRIVPSFTRNWIVKRGGPEIAAPMGDFDRITLILTAASLLLWISEGDGFAAGLPLILAGLLNLIRLARWRGWATLAEPLVTVLHLGYLWLAVGLLLLGASAAGLGVGLTVALHVLTAGSMGTMILAVMTRATLGHTGRELHAGPATVAIYGLVTLAVVGRVAFALLPDAALLWLTSAAWSGAFGLFVAVYLPLVVRAPR